MIFRIGTALCFLLKLMATAGSRLPVLYLAHGGGPMPLMGDPSHTSMVSFMKRVGRKLGNRPKALCIISAHWEEDTVHISTGAEKLLYDYYGFPPETYKVEYRPPGAVAAAEKTKKLLESAGFTGINTVNRGFDHGVFVPLKLMFPDASIPTFQISLLKTLDAARHVQIGQALRQLRDDGVLIVGSGMSFHNMRAFSFAGGQATAESVEFHNWYKSVVENRDGRLHELLTEWKDRAPHAKFCHPREEHLIPLMVTAGAAESDEHGEMIWEESLLGAQVGSAAFGRID